ncbi:hypothetical protein F2Q69_00051742 [Brassica cretica]|uniref:Uncharacterized protein n=1 Tax=Brassica cretica TaxID=69181 RepID=A0A8S9PMS1_BRACR|nr:hypothetical protein F2Q69_00051742 [Brassica cretica]
MLTSQIHFSYLKPGHCKDVVQTRLWRTVDVDTTGRMLFKYWDSGEDIDIVVSSSQTNEEDFDEAMLYQRTNLSSANQGRRCPKLTGVGASIVFTRYCWEHFNLPIELIPLQLDCKASELHCFPHLGTNQRPPQSNLEVLVKLCAGAVKKSHIPGVKITSVDHGSCVGDEAVEGGLADATAPGHSSVN